VKNITLLCHMGVLGASLLRHMHLRFSGLDIGHPVALVHTDGEVRVKSRPRTGQFISLRTAQSAVQGFGSLGAAFVVLSQRAGSLPKHLHLHLPVNSRDVISGSMSRLSNAAELSAELTTSQQEVADLRWSTICWLQHHKWLQVACLSRNTGCYHRRRTL
jgi:hypothetical protein